MHPDLKYAGMLPPLDAPHHLRSTEWGPYREGVVRRSARGLGSFIDVGLDVDAHVPQAGLSSVRGVTVVGATSLTALLSCGALLLQAARQGVRLTLSMGAKPSPATVQGQQVLQAQLALPTGELRGGWWTENRTGAAATPTTLLLSGSMLPS